MRRHPEVLTWVQVGDVASNDGEYFTPLQPLYWVPVIGTWAQIFFGYCTMARLVSLLPWNRKEPFSFELVKRTFLSVPVRGNILQGLPPV